MASFVHTCIHEIATLGSLHYSLDEILAEFTELIGEHSGENMAEIVWKMQLKLGLAGKVFNLCL